MQLLTIQQWKDRIQRQFDSNLYTTLNVNGSETQEITNFEYAIVPTNIEVENLVEPPLAEETIERQFVIDESMKMFDLYLKDDKNTRKASFVNDYDNEDNHCISYFHHYIRDNRYSMNVYVRSQNFDKNFIFDNQTFCLAYLKTFNKLKEVYNDIELGYIRIFVFSLHKIK